MPRLPKVNQRTLLSNTGIFNIETIDLEFSNGQKRVYQRMLGSSEGSVMIIPLLNKDTLLLIREYAAGMHRYELTFPKGLIEVNEQPKAAANRELQEEIGYASNRLHELCCMTIAPGYLQHNTHCILAQDLYPNKLKGDEPEPIEVVEWPLAEYQSLLTQPDFTEARSIAALFLVKDYLNSTS